MRAAGPNRWLYPLAAALLFSASALAAASLVRAEVVGTKTLAAAAAEPALTIHQAPVVLECWQQGRRIIRQDGLQGLAIKAVTRKGAVAFKPADSERPEIFLLPFEDSLCLVAPED